MFDKKVIIMTRWCMFYCITMKTTLLIFFHSNKYNTSEMTYISRFSLFIFWFFVQICKIIFLFKTYFIFHYLYKLDMVLKYHQSQQQWKKLRRCLIRLWFIRGVWMLTWGNKHYSVISQLSSGILRSQILKFQLVLYCFRLRWFRYGGRTWKCRTRCYETSRSFWKG